MKERITDKIHTFVVKAMPGMFKRLMYISSLLAVIDVNHADDKVLAGKLNDIFDLDKSSSVVSDTMRVKNVVWKEFRLEKKFFYHGREFDLDLLKKGKYNYKELDDVASYLIEKTPDWIRYGNTDVMRYDIKRLFRSIPELTEA